MIRLQTEVKVGTYPQKQIDYGEGILTFGSCFSEHIGHYLKALGHKIEVNPFGVLYNPMIICKLIRRLLERKPYTLDELIHYDGLYHSFDHHGSFSYADPQKVLETINRAYQQALDILSTARLMLVTWGTAYIYNYKEDGRVVGNCHKIPSQNFTRRLYSLEELTAYVQETFSLLFDAYPNVRVLTTVSPIRHLRDGAVQNQLSKATLLLMNERLRGSFADKVAYFPAYELVLDEMRDYRFYAEDLTHPNDLAIKLIQERISTYLLTPESQQLGEEVLRLKREWEHKPLHPDHPKYPEQRLKLRGRIEAFAQENPQILLPWYKATIPV